MIIHCWNVRGLNSPLKQHEVVGLMKSKKLDVCGLLKTKLSSVNVARMHKLRLKAWQFVSNADYAAYAGIVVFWNPDTVKVEMLHSSAQGIHVMITSLVQQFCLRSLSYMDLISLLQGEEDKHNGAPVSTYETTDFRECCSDLGIADLNSIGSLFTWTNGRIWTKIDRLGLRELCGKRNFKFFNMWATHPQFLETISQHLSLDIYGSHMYFLCNKLKHLKGRLKSLNNLHFSHISERVARAGKELDETQLLLQNDRDNGDLLALEKKQRLNLVNLKSAEKMFFGQKLKCSFFKDCDKGTRFVHSLMSQRHRKHHIPAIVQNDGMLTSSAEEVGRVFVAYYKDLLGTSKQTIPPRVDVVQSGACINTDSHEFLFAPEAAIGHGFSRPCMIRLMDDIGVAVMLFWFWDRCCRLGFQQLVLAWVAVIGLAGSTSDYF
uniref:Uncharacterized protein n=1 Tax=Populus alba TaxID=43335 RepID=A0A4U5QAY2_POPAL|nr:hypothetical protein D5086_0000112890 [Populus alba]